MLLNVIIFGQTISYHNKQMITLAKFLLTLNKPTGLAKTTYKY